jgi:hypothetical protein
MPRLAPVMNSVLPAKDMQPSLAIYGMESCHSAAGPRHKVSSR